MYNNGLVFEFSCIVYQLNNGPCMNPIGSNICVAIAATMYCVEEETKLKFTICCQCVQLLSNN